MDFEDHNLYARFHKVFEDRLDNTLLVTDSGDEWRYADMESESARLAGFLAAAGAVPGDRISVQTAKTPQALCLYLACLRGGFVFHPLNTGYRAGELEYFLADAEPAVAVCDSGNLDVIGPLVKQLSIPAPVYPGRGRFRHAGGAVAGYRRRPRHCAPGQKRHGGPALFLRHHGQTQGHCPDP